MHVYVVQQLAPRNRESELGVHILLKLFVFTLYKCTQTNKVVSLGEVQLWIQPHYDLVMDQHNEIRFIILFVF